MKARLSSVLLFALLLFGLSNQSFAQCQAAFAISGTDPTFTFSDTSGVIGVSTYWTFGDGSTAWQSNPTHTYAFNGVYQVCLTIADSTQGCTSTYCDSIMVSNASSATCQAAFTVGNSDPTFAFTNGSTNYTVSSWDFGDGNTSTATNPSHTYSANGTYNVCLVIGNGGSCSDTTCQSITVAGVQNCSAQFSAVHDSTLAFTFLIFPTVTGQSPFSYSWSFGDGNTSTQQAPTHQYSGVGVYNLCLTITDANGCTSTYCDSLNVTYKTNQPFSIKVVDPSAPTAVEPTASAADASIFPNPFSDQLKFEIELSSPSPISIQLVDLRGKQVATPFTGDGYAGQNQFRLDTKHLPQGVYFLRYTIGDSQATRKLIKW